MHHDNTTVTGKPIGRYTGAIQRFLLHLIEIYYQSKADMQTLQNNLAGRNECDESTVDRCPEGTPFQPLEKPDLPKAFET